MPRLSHPRSSDRPPAAPPTSAVALKYEPRKADAPRVVAKGRGAIAEQIIAVARAHGVTVREDADLAQILQAVDIDQPIPIEAWAAVAEILSYIYRANRTAAPAAGPVEP